jgi:hypothetical protein
MRRSVARYWSPNACLQQDEHDLQHEHILHSTLQHLLQKHAGFTPACELALMLPEQQQMQS